jgi:hypothetical protein
MNVVRLLGMQVQKLKIINKVTVRKQTNMSARGETWACAHERSAFDIKETASHVSPHHSLQKRVIFPVRFTIGLDHVMT